MQLNLNRARFRFAFFLALFLYCLPTQAQRRSGGVNADGDMVGGSMLGSGAGAYLPTEGWAVSVNAGYEMPQGTLKDDYNGAPTFGLTVAKRWNGFIFTGTVDHRQLKPKQPITEFDPDQPGLGTVTTGNFTGIGIYFGAAYEFLMAPGASVYLGINGGYIYSSSKVIVASPNFNEYVGNNTKLPYFGPKLGLNFAVSNTISIGLQARYSLNVTGVQASTTSGAYATPGFGSLASNLFLTYSF